MSVRLRAGFGAALLALALAPAADAATKRGKLTMSSLKVSKKSVTAGSTVRASGKVRNRKGRRATTGRVTYTLHRTRRSQRGRRLGGDVIKRTRAGKSRKFSERLRIRQTVRPRTYYLVACVRRGAGAGKASCKRRKLVVRARPAPGTPPAPPTTPPTPPTTPPDTRSAGEKLRDAVTFDGMFKHLQAFQNIATANGGNRASGFPGYDASGAYVIEQLRAAGYNPRTEAFDFVIFSEPTPAEFERTAPSQRTYEGDDDDDPSNIEFITMSYSDSGNPTATLDNVLNLDGPATATDGPGCEAEDFAGITGQIALIQRGGCAFAVKALNAQNEGAVGAVIFNNSTDRSEPLAGTLGETAQDGEGGDDINIPVIGTPGQIGDELVAEDATGDDVSVRVKVDALNEPRSSFNVLADTPGGSDNVIIVGSHLDSVDEGPGINDNGTGSAFNLELALQMAKQGIQPANKVRFAFWGAEESGLVGATRYVGAISNEEFAKIRMNLNFDMMGSPNFARLIYDGDFSSTNGQGPASAPATHPGAVEIERDFEDYFRAVGQASEPTDFSGRSDYKPFQDNGVAAGGLFTGAEGIKSTAQRDKFGGIAGVAFDPNYHEAGDDLGNVNRTGFEQMTDAAAFVAGNFAADPGMAARFPQIDPTATRRAPKASRGDAGGERLGDRFVR